MHRFYFPGDLEKQKKLRLNPEQSRHLARVLRLREGNSILLINGEGQSAEAIVTSSSPKCSQVDILSVCTEPARSRITLCFGVPKPKALDFIIHRCTEVGVAAFQPLITRQSLGAYAWNTERWRKILIEVCKQCEQPYLPKLLAPKSLEIWLKERDGDHVLVGCFEQRRHSNPIPLEPRRDYDLLVGSEGGWSEGEMLLLISNGAQPLGLGKNRLRTETAALVAVALLKDRIEES